MYNSVHMKRKVLEHFAGRVDITEMNGIRNAKFKSAADAILHLFYTQTGHTE